MMSENTVSKILNSGDKIENFKLSISEENFTEIHYEDRYDLITKDKIFPAPDWKLLVENGKSPELVALLKVFRDKLPLKPNYQTKQLGTHFTVREIRKPELVQFDYLRMMTKIKGLILESNSINDIKNLRKKCLDFAGWKGDKPTIEAQHLMMSLSKDDKDTLQIDYKDLSKADLLVKEGFPTFNKPSWKKGYSVQNFGKKSYMLCKGVQIIQEDFKTEQEAWNFLKNEYELNKKKQENVLLPKKPEIKNPAREGFVERRDPSENIDTMKFLDSFNFKSVEFGKWVPQKERESLLNKTYDALYDLSELLDIDPLYLGLQKSLSISFGARSSGTIRADYLQDLRMITLPRNTVYGDFASCWCKAFDNWLGTQYDENIQTYSYTSNMSGRLEKNKEIILNLKHLSFKESEAAYIAMYSLFYKNPENVIKNFRTQNELFKHTDQLNEVEQQKEIFLSTCDSVQLETLKAKNYIVELDDFIEKKRTQILPKIRKKLEILNKQKNNWEFSDYFLEAKKLNGKDGVFWSKPNEMLSRAFEYYLENKMKENNQINDFLVSFSDPNLYKDGYRGNPYPVDLEEQKNILKSIKYLIKTTKNRLSIVNANENLIEEIKDNKFSF
jgi:hypothetical protein